MLALGGENRKVRAATLLRGLDGNAEIGTIGIEPRLCMLCLKGEAIDQVLVLDRPERASLEIHLHGSPALLSALAAKVEVEIQVASPAEALLHGALGEGQLQLALEQVGLPFEGFLSGLRGLSADARREPAHAALERSRIARCHAEPCPLVLCGATNAGKSTLMNRLLFMERSLTGPEPGLTRDPVREPTCLSGYPYLLIDTAGEGPTTSEIDARAQARARQERASSALRLLVVDGSEGPVALQAEMFSAPGLVLRNKQDLVQAPWTQDYGPYIAISAEQQSPTELRRVIGEALRALRRLPEAGPVGGAAALDREQLAQLEALV